jgi:polyhydroxyalkanoate synthase subunit PhaC
MIKARGQGRATQNKGEADKVSRRETFDTAKPPAGSGQPSRTTTSTIDYEALAGNFARLMEEGGKAFAAYMKPLEQDKIKPEIGEDFVDMARTIGKVMEYWTFDPQRLLALQTSLGSAYLDLWGATAKRLTGAESVPIISADPKDKRFADPAWSQNQFFDFLKQAYLLTMQWAGQLVENAEIDDHTREKAAFYVKQIGNAISPTNFIFTNPELLRETWSSNAENLVRGMQMLAEDIKAGEGQLKIRQSDPSAFEVGQNLATTPGKVIFQNDLFQLIQYEATTREVLKVPLLIVPPWINKFYILDLTPEKSFIKWCVNQGITVFVVSWVNPDARLAEKNFEDYMREGVIAALNAIKGATGETKVHAIGYCVGGTLLAVALAYLAAKKQERVKSATLFAAQVDFSYAGDLKVFVDEERVEKLERHMKEKGYLEASQMATAFNMLRPNELIWPYVINNYLRGKKPYPFDILYWNSDATRMSPANHSFYLRNCYLENNITRDKMKIAGVKLDLHKVTTPIYNLATRDDHIAPAKSVLFGSQFFGGPVKFVLADSGHIAGVINPPDAKKYQYWTGAEVQSADVAEGTGVTEDTIIEAWMKKATKHPGSWWPDWLDWLKSQDARRVPARKIGGGKLKALEDAPGSYVRVKSWA